MNHASAYPRPAAGGLSFSVPPGEGVLAFPHRLRPPRGHIDRAVARRVGAALLAALFVASLIATSVPSIISSTSATVPNAQAPTVAAARSKLAAMPVSFEQNLGQVDPQVRYLSRFGNATVFLTNTSAVFAGPNGSLTMALSGANPNPAIAGTSELPGTVNYFIGNNPAGWHSNISTYRGVSAQGVYPGVDLAWHGTGPDLEYDFTVAPGANPSQIAFKITGAKALGLTSAGDLKITMPNNSMMLQKAPTLFQDIGGRRQPVQGGYRIQGDVVSFRLGAYDHTRPLTIDPVAYSTYLGGSANDQFTDIVVDSTGAMYVIGGSSSTNFPTASPLQGTNHGSNDVVVVKINPSGSALLYSTYLGGTGSDNGVGIALDASGDAYLLGNTTSSNFPTASPIQASSGGGTDAFVAELNPAGSALLYSTYLGGSGTETPQQIAVDATGAAYVAGHTASTNFPTTVGAFQAAKNATNVRSAFVAKVAPGGSALAYSTYLGGSADDEMSGRGLAVNANGDAYVTGFTSSTNFPTTPGALQTAYAGGPSDAFVTELNPSGSGLVYSTFLGGATNQDRGFGIALDVNGDAYVTGWTQATDFPTTPGAFLTTNTAGFQVPFVSELNPAGSTLVYSTYLGGSGSGLANAVAVDSSGDAYVTGQTSALDFPTTPGAFQTTNGFAPNGGPNAFMTELNPTGSALVYSTYLGGNGGTNGDLGTGIAVDAARNVYVSGRTQSTNFPTTPGALQTTFGGGTIDGFVTVFPGNGTSADVSVTQTATPSPATAGSPLTYSITASNAGPDAGRNATISDTLDPSTTFVSASTGASGGTCTQASGVVTCSVGPIPVSGSVTATVVATPSTPGGTVSNTVTVSSADPDPNLANNSSTLATPVGGAPGADLAVTQTAAPLPAEVGQALTYTTTVTNNGPNAATGVSVADTLPPGTTFSGDSGPFGACGPGPTATCGFGTLPAGASATMTATITPTGTGTITNTVTASSNNSDPNPANNTSALATTVGTAADLSLSKSASPSPGVAANAQLTYTLTTTNHGPSPSTGEFVTDTIPSGESFVSATSAQGSCTNNSGTVVCGPSSLASGASTTMSLVVTAPPAAGTVTNVATVSGADSDPNTANNTASVTTTVFPPDATDIGLAVAAPTSIAPGGSLTYDLVSTNIGPNPATGVGVTDTLPAAATFTSASTTQGVCTASAGTLSCALGSLAAGSTVTTTVVVQAPTTTGVTLTATASAGGNQVDPNPANNSATNSTFVSYCGVSGVSSATSCTYSSPGSDAFTVPPGVTQVTYTVVGAQAGGVNVGVPGAIVGPGGAGGEAIASFAVTPGQVAQVDVAGKGTDGGPVSLTGGFGNGPSGGTGGAGGFGGSNNGVPGAAGDASGGTGGSNPANGGNGSGGGGSSDVRVNPGTGGCALIHCDLSTRSVAAGGGGGVGGNGGNGAAVAGHGGAGGGTVGGDGQNGTQGLNFGVAGTGGTQSAPGTGGPANPPPNNGTSGTSGTLGNGGTGGNGNGGGGAASGGAGGGYYGGGGGGGAGGSGGGGGGAGAGGGGGSGFIAASALPGASLTPGVNAGNVNAGNGQVVVTWAAPSADLSLTKTGPVTATAGVAFTYTLTTTDNGPSPATGVTVTDLLPAAETFASASPGCTNTSGTVVCTMGNLASGASATATITVTPTSVGAVTNTATVSANEADPNPANNSSSATTTVSTAPLRADVAVTKTATATATVTTPITYTVTARNNGPNGATGVNVTDTLPAGITFVSASSTQGTCSNASGTVTCTQGPLASGATSTITIVVTAPSSPTTITNTATIKANEADPNTANNTASATTQVVAASAGSADLSIQKYAFADDLENPHYQVGHGFWYVLVIHNAGPSTATGVTVTDQLPAGLTYNLSVATQGSCTQAAGKLTCKLATLNKNGTAFVAIRVTPTHTGTFTNTATVSGTQPDPNPANNSSKVTITVAA
ncbi:MAG TPA: SBBP repeat-containing protein [Actinomycetota bacterium]